MATTSLKDVALGIRNIGSRTTFAGAAEVDFSAEEDRLINSIVGEGAVTPSNSFVVAKGSAATMNVVVGSGSAKTDTFVVPGTSAGQGTYIVRLEGATETFALGAADPSNARLDEIYIVVQDDAYDSSGRALAVLAVRKGDASGSPAAPGPDSSWDAYSLLATVTVPASAADIIACTVTDERSAAQLLVDAKTIEGYVPGDFALAGHNHAATYAALVHVHDAATTSVAGFMSAADKLKLDGIEEGAGGDMTAAQILTAIKTVDGASSGLDADLLDGIQASSFSQTSHTHDTRYYTESEVDTKLAAKLTIAGSGKFTAYGANKYTYQARNIIITDVDPASSGDAKIDGDVFFKYVY